MVCGKDVYLPYPDLCVKAIKLKDSSFLALLYAKLLFGLHIIFRMAGQCFQSLFFSSSHSLKMHLPVCQSAAAIVASTDLTPMERLWWLLWGHSRAGGTTSLGYPSLKAAHELGVFWLCPTADIQKFAVPASFG